MKKRKDREYTTFSERIKDEYFKLSISKKKIVNILELAGIYRTNASLTLKNNEYSLLFSSKSKACILRVSKLIANIYESESNIYEVNDESLNKKATYFTSLEANYMDDFLSIVGFDLLGNLIVSQDDFLSRLKPRDNSISYIRGAFLGGGTITNPNKGYNLEIVCPNKLDGYFLEYALKNLMIEAKIRSRKDRTIIYIKNSDFIGEFLALTGASNSYLEYENFRVKKATSNQFNRTSNFETSNLDKQLKASARQLAILKYIKENIGFENIEESLREVARLRIENKDKSIKEIGQMMNPKLSKSGLNYRLKKLEAIYLDHKNGEDI